MVSTVINEEDLTDVLCSLLSPTRAFGYVVAYMAGAQKLLSGHFTFFEVNTSHVGGVMNYFQKTKINPHVYVVLRGRMIPNQRYKLHGKNPCWIPSNFKSVDLLHRRIWS